MRRLTETLQELSWLLAGIKNGVAEGGKSTTEIVTTGARFRSCEIEMRMRCAVLAYKSDWTVPPVIPRLHVHAARKDKLAVRCCCFLFMPFSLWHLVLSDSSKNWKFLEVVTPKHAKSTTDKSLSIRGGSRKKNDRCKKITDLHHALNFAQSTAPPLQPISTSHHHRRPTSSKQLTLRMPPLELVRKVEEVLRARGCPLEDGVDVVMKR